MGQSPAPAFHLQDQDPDSMLWAFLTPGSLPAPLHCPHCPLGCRSPSHPAEATTVRPGPRPRPSPWRGGRGAGVGRQMAEPTWGRPVEVAGKDPLGAHLHAFWKATPGCHLSPNGGPSGRAPSPRPGPHGQRTSVGRPGPCTPGATWAVRCSFAGRRGVPIGRGLAGHAGSRRSMSFHPEFCFLESSQRKKSKLQ